MNVEPNWARGLDVSAWQASWTDASWAHAAQAGYSFAFIKAFESVQDVAFPRHWKHAKASGILRGAYGYLHVDRPVRPQAEGLVDALRAHGPGELPCVVDIETDKGKTAQQVTDAVSEWVDIVHEATERRPIVYTYLHFARTYLVGQQLAECPLWIAQYGVSWPDSVPGWKRWEFWQHSGRGVIAGVSGNVDLNVYRGTLDELRYAYVVVT